jgi:hypothetical protein
MSQNSANLLKIPGKYHFFLDSPKQFRRNLPERAGFRFYSVPPSLELEFQEPEPQTHSNNRQQ